MLKLIAVYYKNKSQILVPLLPVVWRYSLLMASCLTKYMCTQKVAGCCLQEDRKIHCEGLKKENDELISRINAIRAAQAEQEPKITKVSADTETNA